MPDIPPSPSSLPLSLMNAPHITNDPLYCQAKTIIAADPTIGKK
jgi:hypothetical protein